MIINWNIFIPWPPWRTSSYRRSLRLLKENLQHFKTRVADLDPDGSVFFSVARVLVCYKHTILRIQIPYRYIFCKMRRSELLEILDLSGSVLFIMNMDSEPCLKKIHIVFRYFFLFYTRREQFYLKIYTVLYRVHNQIDLTYFFNSVSFFASQIPLCRRILDWAVCCKVFSAPTVWRELVYKVS